MLRAIGLTKAYGAFDVFQGVDWALPPRTRWGLVGANGAGKTTLVRILSGLEEPDAGRVDRPGGSTIAYLPQEGTRGLAAPPREEGTLLEAILSPFTEIAAVEAEMMRLHERMAEEGADLDALTARLGDVQHRFEALGGFNLEAEAKIILTGLGFEPADASRPLAEFSGGYRMRALLGSLLLRRPDYLLLDEPTNHLDLDGVAWLESYLSRLTSAVAVVSHDRLFLNRVVESIAELERGKIHTYRGGYDAYRAEKEAQRDRAEAAAGREKKREAEVRRFIDRFRYKATKARQAQSRIKMLEKTERTEVPADEITWGFRFPHLTPAPRFVLRAENVVKSYGTRRVLDGVDLVLERGDRVAVVGPNGCGKSTLLKIVAGMGAADDGDIRLGDGVISRFFAQHVVETLTPGRTVLEELQETAPSRKTGELRSLLGIFQFSGDDVFKKVESLSGGEKSRLALARLTLDPGHLLVLDEPTNHLDFASREALEEAINDYEGTVLFVSHDRYFINRVAGRVAAFEAGRVWVVEGDYDAYAAEAAARAELARETAGEGAGTTPGRRRDDRRVTAESRNERNRALRLLRRNVASIEEAIASRENRLKEIESIFSNPATYRSDGLAEGLGREQKALEAELPELLRQWEAASSELHAAEF
ncbi:MAG TPA: ABC-F family ATP-binding cassette domain-containing protein [Verrucomicrobiae bacterium]|nr:ABC-F family ATP-binding cassette domain-containing protein [Verrucomicrobiae bacterium]